MTEPNRNANCKFLSADKENCVAIAAVCNWQTMRARCPKYLERETPAQDSGVMIELRGKLRYTDDGRWEIDSPRRVTRLDYAFADFVDEPVKLTIEKVRE